MTDIRTRLADALRDQWTPSTVIYGTDEPAGFNSPNHWAHHVADVLLSLPGIAIIDTTKIDRIAAAIAGNWPDTYAKSWPWDDIPEHAQEAYRDRARAAILAATEER